MVPPAGWQNPISALPGQTQAGVDARLLLPSRRDVLKRRVDWQRLLLKRKQKRHTPIQVTRDGVIFDGHHGVRAAAEEGLAVDVLIVDQPTPAVGVFILDLPVR